MVISADLLMIAVERGRLFPEEVEEPAWLTFFVYRPTLEHFRVNGPTWKYHSLRLVRSTLEDPCVVFRGLRRHGFTEGFCYVSNPSNISVGQAETEEVPLNHVFLVFVDGLVAFDWEFRLGKPGVAGHPLNSDTDFEEVIWAKQN